MKKAFSAEDLYLHHRVSHVGCSPASERAACTLHSIDHASGNYVSCIWTATLDGSAPVRLTEGPGLDQSPVWSPDGRSVAFLGDRSGDGSGAIPQLHLVDADGGEARQIGAFPKAVTDLRWFPDGESLLVSATVAVDPDLRGRRSGDAPPKRDASSPEVAWRLPYKADGTGYLLDHEVHLFAVDVDSGEQTRLTDGPFHVQDFAISPDGGRIAYSRTRDGRFAHCSDLWTCDADGGGARRMTEAHATVVAPAWSPDGRWVAFCGAEEEGDAELGLWVSNAATGEVRRVGNESLNVAENTTLHWRDGEHLQFVRAFHGRHQVASIGLGDAEPRVLVDGDRQYGVFACTGEHLVFSINHPTLPSELWSASRDGGDVRQVSLFNAWWDERTTMQGEIRSFEVPDGLGGIETIEGWLLRGPDHDGPSPLLDDIHGGPASYALMDFGGNLHWQILCSRGWVVLALNAVGSASYGAEFSRRLRGHWGQYDTPQHLAAIEQLQAEDVCDARVAVSGKSYGGYLGAWMIGHTDVFKAAVVISPVGNIEAHYGTSDGGYYSDPFFMSSEPLFDRALARTLSPLQHIERATTPTLFMQGKDDERCPKCQSEELFVTLMRAGDTPAELVLYPGGTHSFLGSGPPTCRIDGTRRIVEWVTRHADAPAGAEATAMETPSGQVA